MDAVHAVRAGYTVMWYHRTEPRDLKWPPALWGERVVALCQLRTGFKLHAELVLVWRLKTRVREENCSRTSALTAYCYVSSYYEFAQRRGIWHSSPGTLHSTRTLKARPRKRVDPTQRSTFGLQICTKISFLLFIHFFALTSVFDASNDGICRCTFVGVLTGQVSRLWPWGRRRCFCWAMRDVRKRPPTVVCAPRSMPDCWLLHQ